MVYNDLSSTKMFSVMDFELCTFVYVSVFSSSGKGESSSQFAAKLINKFLVCHFLILHPLPSI